MHEQLHLAAVRKLKEGLLGLWISKLKEKKTIRDGRQPS
jgi:hypothetical protein